MLLFKCTFQLIKEEIKIDRMGAYLIIGEKTACKMAFSAGAGSDVV